MKLTESETNADSVACWLHNNSAAVAGNTQPSDIEWFARWLHGFTGRFGMGRVDTCDWIISNEAFKKLKLTPDRSWTGKRWETLSPKERENWLKFAFACLAALPVLCDRIGHRGMEQAKAIHLLVELEIKERLKNNNAD